MHSRRLDAPPAELELFVIPVLARLLEVHVRVHARARVLVRHDRLAGVPWASAALAAHAAPPC